MSKQTAVEIGSFRKKTFIEVFCAKCGVRYSDDGEYESVFQDKAEAIETITSEDYWIVQGQKAFCEKCNNISISETYKGGANE